MSPELLYRFVQERNDMLQQEAELRRLCRREGMRLRTYLARQLQALALWLEPELLNPRSPKPVNRLAVPGEGAGGR